MKVQMTKEEVIELVRDHLPIPPGFRMTGARWEKYADNLDIEIEVIPPRLSMDRPLFPPQRPCVPDSLPETPLLDSREGVFEGSGPDLE